MSRGYYAACAGLVSRTQALDTIANSLANVSTAGFRVKYSRVNGLHSLGYGSEILPMNRR